MARKCVFCGSSLQGQKSNEHIFPRWLQKHLGSEYQQLYHTLYTIEGKPDNCRDFPFYSHVSGLVCKQCNTGWMNEEMEKPAKPLLVPLVDGTYDGDISPEDCHIIALWLFKTALTLHSASQQERYVPTEHYATLYKRRAIPRGVVITIAYHKDRDKNDLSWIQSGNWGLPRWIIQSEQLNAYLKKAYRITMRAGHLAWRIHYWPKENRPPVGLSEYDPSSVRYIHPIRGKGVSWPPARPISGIREFDASLMIFSPPPA